MKQRWIYSRNAVFIVLLGWLLAACQFAQPAPAFDPPAQPVTGELVFYSWREDATSMVFDLFTTETGISVRHEGFDSLDEAEAAIRQGADVDVVVLESARLPELIADGQLAELNFSHLPNFKYISANFRDLIYDPGNRHSIPNSWGTTGIVVRTDRIATPISRWSDLWRPELAGRMVFWATQPRDMLGLALHALGYSANSENPDEIDAAAAHLAELAQSAIWLDDADSSAPWLLDGAAVAAMGWAYDYWALQEAGVPAAYILPDDGAMLWNDNFVIPAHSPNKAAAERFIDFLLRPEIAARVIEANYYPMAHETARSFVSPEIRVDPVMYPNSRDLRNAELQVPLSADGQRLQDAAWRLVLSEIP